MKKIYTFTLESEDYPSEKFRYNLRLFAYLMYDELYNYDGDGFTPLNINDKIVCNRIYDGKCSGQYYLDSDFYDDGCIYYEPFLIGNCSFGLTLIDDTIDEKILYELIEQVLFIMKFDCEVKINNISYLSNGVNDETNRRKAVCLAYTTLGCEVPSRKFSLGFGKKKTIKRRYDMNYVRAIGRY